MTSEMQQPEKTTEIFLGIDIGTSSARAVALEKVSKKVLATSVRQLEIHQPEVDNFEQSSDQIWRACCETVSEILAQKLFNANSVKGIGFDATCSLVVLDAEGRPLPVTRNHEIAEKTYDVIMWMDHRALAETEEINKTHHPALRLVSNSISPEMEPPKLLWLKRNKAEIWGRAGNFMDLADFLSFKATGDTSRSVCCLGCKWLYKTFSEKTEWDSEFYQSIGLADILDDNFSKIGSKVLYPGSPVGKGLNQSAAKDLGLPMGTPVATSLIDAHAGALGALATAPSVPIDIPPIKNRLTLICGTSTCHMALSESPISIVGIPGPHLGAVLPNFYLNEAGQHAVGSVLDMVVNRFGFDVFKTGQTTTQKHRALISELEKLEPSEMVRISKDVHVWPDYRGNRTPLNDPDLRGGIVGLDFQDQGTSVQEKFRQLTVLYLAHIQAFALETRFIIETLEASGHSIKILYMCGGLQKNSIYVQAHADVLQRTVIMPECEETVALGSAILGACASGQYRGLEHAMAELGQTGKVVEPRKELKGFYEKKYEIFRKFGQLITDANKNMG